MPQKISHNTLLSVLGELRFNIVFVKIVGYRNICCLAKNRSQAVFCVLSWLCFQLGHILWQQVATSEKFLIRRMYKWFRFSTICIRGKCIKAIKLCRISKEGIPSSGRSRAAVCSAAVSQYSSNFLNVQVSDVLLYSWTFFLMKFIPSSSTIQGRPQRAFVRSPCFHLLIVCRVIVTPFFYRNWPH